VEINKMLLGQRIREQRIKRGLTIEKLAEKCNRSESFIGNIERGDDTPSLATLLSIADCLSISLEYLLQDTLNSSEIKTDSSNYYQREISGELQKMTMEEQKTIYNIINSVKNYHAE